MYNIRLIIEYNGAAFQGWQQQPGLRTVESELKRILSVVLREEVRVVYAAGRTDAGVHARGQVVNFVVRDMPDLRRLRFSVSSLLKNDLAVLSADTVPLEFRARKHAIARQYSYRIDNRDVPLVLDHSRVWHVPMRLNLEAMKRAAAVVLGEHDFTSFRGAKCAAKTPVKRILESELSIEGKMLTYRVVGHGFLKYMVRNIVGTMVEIGRGMRPADAMESILNARDRRRAGVTAPAYALYLDWVRYPDHLAPTSMEPPAGH
ncbi:MAG: hypothetical protein RL417_511 [Pseudomonadota bacterium]